MRELIGQPVGALTPANPRKQQMRALAHWTNGSSRPAHALAILCPVSAPLIEFPADDPDRARRFWHGVLGVSLSPRDAAEGSGWQTDSDGLRLGIHERGPGPGDTACLPYFTVDDLAAALERGS